MGRSSDRSVAVRSCASLTRLAILVSLVMVTVFAVVFVTPRIVHACSCSRDRTLSDYADEVEVAFVGRQIEGTSVSGGSAWLLEVDWVYKGRAGASYRGSHRPRCRLVRHPLPGNGDNRCCRQEE